MIYRDLLGPRFDDDDNIISISLFRSQPTITRVNRQIRAESLPIYYAENRFCIEVNLVEDEYCGFSEAEIDYVDFCDFIQGFTPAQAQSAGIQNSLRHILDLRANISVETNVALGSVARFAKIPEIEFWSEADWWDLEDDRLGDDETDWTDRTSVRALIKRYMEALTWECSSPTYAQDSLMHVLWLLGVNLTSDSTTLVSIT